MNFNEASRKILAMSDSEIARLLSEFDGNPVDPFIAGCAAFFSGCDPYEAEQQAIKNNSLTVVEPDTTASQHEHSDGGVG